MNALATTNASHARQLPLAYRFYAHLDRVFTALGALRFLKWHPAMVFRNRLNRLLFKYVFRKDETATVLSKDGFLMVVPLNDQAAASILFERRYSPLETQTIKNLIPHCSSFTDVGANLGYFSLLVHTHSDNGYPVISVEPNSRLCALIRDSMQLNGMPSDDVVCAAVGAGSGQAALRVDDQCSSIGTVLETHAPLDDCSMVEMVKLNDIAPRGAPAKPPLVKIDVEGHELKVLEGGNRVMGEGAVLLCEVSCQTAAEMGRIVKEYDYRVFDHSGNACVLETPGFRGRKDFVFVPSSLAESIQPILQHR